MHKMTCGILGVMLLAGAGQAAAADRLSDTAYVKAMRCSGLAEARGVDVAGLDAMLKTQKHGRHEYIANQAKATRKAAMREASSAGARSAEVDAELGGGCAAFISSPDALTQRTGARSG